MEKIILFDPSKGDNNDVISANLGDVIINDSVLHFLKLNFKDYELIKISTHVPLNKKERNLIKNSKLAFVGGTNLLSSDLRVYNQWKSNYFKFLINIPIVDNSILMGVGWWQYQKEPTNYTKRFYRRLLYNQFYHSVRDSYTKNMVNGMGIKNCLNTSCPTTWGLDGIISDRINQKSDNVLLMLTDYHPNPDVDNKLIEILLNNFNSIYFFPQGRGDLDYIKSLNYYKSNKEKFFLLNHVLEELNELVTSKDDIVYIGTRLHGGIKCLQNGISSLILSNDNRSRELGKDINLAVVDRNDFSAIIDWINFRTNNGKISIPINTVNIWKNQFKNL